MDMPAAAPRPPVGNLAVFIDADNLSDATALDHALQELRQRAERILYKRAYGRAESLKAMLLAGHGLAFLPESAVARELARGEIAPAGDARWTLEMEVRLYRDRANTRPELLRLWAYLTGAGEGGDRG